MAYRRHRHGGRALTGDAAPVHIAVDRAHPERCGLLAVHANGFCKETLRPVVDRVVDAVPGADPWLMDLRGHGASGKGAPPYGMQCFGEDVLAVVDTIVGVPVALGHSSGGAAVSIAELEHPGSFSALVLVEPIILPPPHQRMDNPMAQVADRRRRAFPSRDAARTRFSAGPFSTWTSEALDAYIDHGFAEVEGEWVLRCAPEVEADVYREGGNNDAWERVGAIDIPVVIVAGEHSTTHHGRFLDQLAGQFRDPEVVIVPGAGHLVPMEDPAAVADVVVAVLRSVA